MGMAAALWLVAGCDGEKRVPKAVAVSEDGAMEVKAMTFNIRYENENDKGRRNWGGRVTGIVKMLRVERPDVLGRQEGLHGQVADLRASLTDYGFEGTGRTDGLREGEYCGIFSSATGSTWMRGAAG